MARRPLARKPITNSDLAADSGCVWRIADFCGKSAIRHKKSSRAMHLLGTTPERRLIIRTAVTSDLVNHRVNRHLSRPMKA
jgi:hypothetical protein